MDGIRAAFEVGRPENCPVAATSARTDETIESVARAGPVTDAGTVVEEFEVRGNPDFESDGLSPVFSTDATAVYRFERDVAEACACEIIESQGCPVTRIRAKEGVLMMEIYAPDLEVIRGVIADLRAEFSNVRLRHLARSEDATGEAADLVLVERSRLTDRQREVLETAYEMGYFNHPKQANAGEVAEELGITTSTFTEHLSAAQSKILEELLTE